jgi:magnesium chelatase subunit I
MGHNVIIIGPPGIGKTTFAKNISKLLPEKELNDCAYNCDLDSPICPTCKVNNPGTKKSKGHDRFIRIQGSPDLSVEDILGDIDPIKAMKYGPFSLEAFTPGKIFKANNGILFFDEVNRCPEKLQNSLLQVLEEKFATIGNYSINLPANFIFIGTMNPEDSSTEKLSEVFLDRFDIIYMNHPETPKIEKDILLSKAKNLGVDFPDNLLDLMIKFIFELRGSDKLEKKPSVRASISLYERAQSNAFLAQRGKVEFKDIKNAIVSVLSHRISLKASIKFIENIDDFIENKFKDFCKREDIPIDKGHDP